MNRDSLLALASAVNPQTSVLPEYQEAPPNRHQRRAMAKLNRLRAKKIAAHVDAEFPEATK